MSFEPASDDGPKEQALKRMVLNLFEQLISVSTKVTAETLSSVNSTDSGQMADIIASSVVFNLEDKQKVLECIDTVERMEILVEILTSELEIATIENDIRETRFRKQNR